MKFGLFTKKSIYILKLQITPWILYLFYKYRYNLQIQTNVKWIFVIYKLFFVNSSYLKGCFLIYPICLTQMVMISVDIYRHAPPQTFNFLLSRHSNVRWHIHGLMCSTFSNVFDQLHFIKSLQQDVRILKELPKELESLPRARKHFTSWSGVSYYEEMMGLWKEYQASYLHLFFTFSLKGVHTKVYILVKYYNEVSGAFCGMLWSVYLFWCQNAWFYGDVLFVWESKCLIVDDVPSICRFIC